MSVEARALARDAEPVVVHRLQAGPPPGRGAESFADQMRRLGPRPRGGHWLVDAIRAAGLRGRGGAWFPTASKWERVRSHSKGNAVVVVNASEGEPLSAKDRSLMALRPHLVVDGAVLAAESIGAAEVVVYISDGARIAEKAARRAIGERRKAGADEPPVRVVKVRHRYVAGESSAAVNRINGGKALPRFTPPHVSESGVGGLPTLVQNAETLAHVAMIARNGGRWFREMGTTTSPGTTLMTVGGFVKRPGVYEVQLGSSVAEVFQAAGGAASMPSAVLIGGYFGGWLTGARFDDAVLDWESLKSGFGASIGCGVLAFMPPSACPLAEAARVLEYLAMESAGQCGPCVFGLRAIADTMHRLVRCQAGADDVARLREWSGVIRGRGACRHPDGAVGFLASTLEVFSAHVDHHITRGACTGVAVSGFPRPPAPRRWWQW